SCRFLCTATRQKNTGQSSEEEQRHPQNEQKEETSSAEKLLSEEKIKLEEQVKEMTGKRWGILGEWMHLSVGKQQMSTKPEERSVQGFCKDLLEVADVLEKATTSVPKEEITDQNPHLKNLYEGLVMTEVQLQKVFSKHGLVKLNPVGAKFDPYEHEALFSSPMEGKEPGSVAIVTKIGYKLHGRTLRPALVGVVQGGH
uniref:GrpE protein homolog n=1 Tax=Callorhinchus milii TaxID=7868 RepID=A0A4W3HYG7_CALMI